MRHLWPQSPEASWSHAVLATLSDGYPPPGGRLPTRYSPVRHFTRGANPPFTFDLHVLSTPPAFVLSQDQTLHFDFVENKETKRDPECATRVPCSVFKDPLGASGRLVFSGADQQVYGRAIAESSLFFDGVDFFRPGLATSAAPSRRHQHPVAARKEMLPNTATRVKGKTMGPNNYFTRRRRPRTPSSPP